MKNDIFLSTKRRITAISIGIVFLCLIIFALITQAFYKSKLLDNVDRQLIDQKKIFLGEEITRENKKKIYDYDNDMHKNFNIFPEDKPMKIPPNLILISYNNDAFENMSNTLYFSEDNLPTLPKESNEKIVNFQYNDYNFRGITVTNGEQKIQVIANIDVEVHSINRLRNSIFFSLVILIIISSALAAYLASKVIKPVKKAYEKQIYFVQDASHEMRTPVSVIKGKVELLAHSPGDTIDDHFEHISKIMSEIRGLEKLNNDLLLLSKEDLELGLNITSFSLDDFIDEISEFYIDLAEIRHRDFQVIKPKNEIIVSWEKDKIKRAIIILLENAFKYTNEGGSVKLIVEDLTKSIKVTVKDDGIGIKDEDQNRIFDRFYRSKEVRGKNISGTGIGLSLLKSITKNFGIKLKVNSKYGEESEFILSIPKIIK
ncbi:HAMP domain-containing histidine kinase [Clostridium botulinum]|uniref:sensor histidine kinase n=1 Tax=Clostridium botulinum TaxID=1491 RepID=UPI000772F217|nr:HAMP domain-containing sensor histidine kinase [Clostridium botulinum]NFE74036.1 HAMP domain-containing histidine kinase [Clostridium botulinum]NFH81139.1 HAMP domain-containing histidine kinase [Clostridium botulinum]NFH84012.1 HAMP domain-containing histidine kinase [Clostridium botulinum]NFI12361.1 HAMP domain-containing histidine kinase [Clostridium botulinum]NFI14643.1 HAMP domain-containing histidine kinase [Clostridium botulinum]